MKILCYGKSEARQKARCDFFSGAGCIADWAVDIETATRLLSIHSYEMAILGPTLSEAERSEITQLVRSFSVKADVVALPACEPAEDDNDEPEAISGLPTLLAKLKATQFNCYVR